MALTITWDNKPILQCANRVIIRFYAEIENVIQKNNFSLNFHMDELMWYLYEWCGSGIGFDISEYIYSKEDFELFLKIFKEVLSRIEDGYSPKRLLNDFYNELLNIYEKFEPDPLLLSSIETFDTYIKKPEMLSAAIKYNRKYLLACPSQLFCLLFESIIPNVLHIYITSVPENISSLLKDLSKRKTGSLDFSNYTNCKEELVFFTDLTRRAIDEIYERYPADTEYCKMFYETFYRNLLETIESFPYFTPEESKLTSYEIVKRKSKISFEQYVIELNKKYKTQEENNDN